MILVVFHTAGINEKKKGKKKMVQKLEMGYCPLSMRLGAGLGVAAGWARARLGVLGVQAGAGARAWRARHSAQGAAAGWGAGQRAGL